MTRATDALSYMDLNDVLVLANRGAACSERGLLRAIVNNTTGNVLQLAYIEKLQKQLPDPQNRAEVYQATHEVFFATNFGRDTITGVDMVALGNVFLNLLSAYANDIDVLAEILICIYITGQWNSTADSAYAAYTAAYDALDRTDFNNVYHEVLTGGVLFKLKG